MFKPKNALISLAVVALLAACGGGGGGDDDDNTNTGGNGNPPPTTDTGNQTTTDSKLANTLVLQGGTGVAVVASDEPGTARMGGYTFNDFTTKDLRPANHQYDPNDYGLYQTGGNADVPLRRFGIRVNPVAGEDDSETGRVAFELQDQAEGATQEILRIEIDNVTTSVTGDALNVAPGTGSKTYVYVRNAAGQESDVVSFDTPTTVLTTTAATQGAYDVVLDVEAVVAAAKAAGGATNATILNSLADFASETGSPFQVTFTMNNANLSRSADESTFDPGTEVTGKEIKVGNRNGVSASGGVTGYYGWAD